MSLQKVPGSGGTDVSSFRPKRISYCGDIGLRISNFWVCFGWPVLVIKHVRALTKDTSICG